MTEITVIILLIGVIILLLLHLPDVNDRNEDD